MECGSRGFIPRSSNQQNSWSSYSPCPSMSVKSKHFPCKGRWKRLNISWSFNDHFEKFWMIQDVSEIQSFHSLDYPYNGLHMRLFFVIIRKVALNERQISNYSVSRSIWTFFSILASFAMNLVRKGRKINSVSDFLLILVSFQSLVSRFQSN